MFHLAPSSLRFNDKDYNLRNTILWYNTNKQTRCVSLKTQPSVSLSLSLSLSNWTVSVYFFLRQWSSYFSSQGFHSTKWGFVEGHSLINLILLDKVFPIRRADGFDDLTSKSWILKNNNWERLVRFQRSVSLDTSSCSIDDAIILRNTSCAQKGPSIFKFCGFGESDCEHFFFSCVGRHAQKLW
jgi:hypothetical protein